MRTDVQPGAGGHLRLADEIVDHGFRRVSARKAAADEVKMSPHQVKTALRVAAVPKEEFEAAVEP